MGSHAALITGVMLLAGCAAPVADRSYGRTSVPPEAPGGRPLVVGSDMNSPPFVGQDQRGRPFGRDVDLMEAIGHWLGRPVQWMRLPSDGLLDAPGLGEVDLVCAAVGVTAGRAERVVFSRPTFHTELVAVARAGPDEPHTLAELQGQRVAAASGTTAEQALRAALPGAAAVLDDGDGLSLTERLLLGEIDAVIVDGPAAQRLVAGAQGALVRLPDRLAPERYALALAPDAVRLRERVDACLAGLAGDGTLSRLDARYGLIPFPSP